LTDDRKDEDEDVAATLASFGGGFGSLVQFLVVIAVMVKKSVSFLLCSALQLWSTAVAVDFVEIKITLTPQQQPRFRVSRKPMVFASFRYRYCTSMWKEQSRYFFSSQGLEFVFGYILFGL